MSTTVSSVTSHFPSPQNGFTTTLASTIASGAATVPLNSVAGYTNGQVFVGVVEPTSTTAKQTFTGIVDTAGVQITSVVWTAGTNQTHNAGSTVVDYATATHIGMMTKGILVEHAQAGTHTNITQADANYIKDTSGNELLKWSTTASAVNEVTIKNAATGTAPTIKASGGDAAVNLNLQGKGLAKTVTIGAGAATIFPYDYVLSGCVWSGDSYGVTLAASMTAGVVVINGNPVTVAAVTARSFTASKDVYVDVLDNGDGTGLLVYTDNTINAASPALASNSVRIAIIVTGAGSIAAATSVNQGQETMVLPIASSTPYAVTDSLGNLICPRDPRRSIIGYRQVISNQAGIGAETDLTGLSIPVIVPTGRKIEITFKGNMTDTGAVVTLTNRIKEGATVLRISKNVNVAATNILDATNTVVLTPSAGSHTYKVSLQSSGANGTLEASATEPAFVVVKLV